MFWRRRAPTASLVLVAGSGRSGTSLLAGILQRLGYTVPPPELPPHESNPRGFAESKWVVQFHRRLVGPDGLGPDALTPEAERELRDWLAATLLESERVVIKDPLLGWMLPLWRRCTDELGVTPRFVTMLRHPAAVVHSKRRWYGEVPGDADRLAEWVNLSTLTEEATRDVPRAFVHYDDLLADWRSAVAGVEDRLGLPILRRASPAAVAEVAAFVDPGLRRSTEDWAGLAVPDDLRERAEATWAQLTRLAGA